MIGPLYKDVLNQINVTLYEKIQTGSLYSNFIFEFKNDTTLSSSWCFADDISSSPQRHNQFLISESLETGSNKINFPIVGYYHYNVYQNFTNTASAAGNYLLEKGKAYVAYTSSIFDYISQSDPYYKVYKYNT